MENDEQTPPPQEENDRQKGLLVSGLKIFNDCHMLEGEVFTVEISP